MKITLDNVQQVEPGIWRAALQPIEVTSFGHVPSRCGAKSVVLIVGNASFDRSNETLSFEHSDARPLNVGEMQEAIVLSASDGNKQPKVIVRPDVPISQNVARLSTGDDRFVQELPRVLRELGETLLREVRKHFRGSLRYYERSGKYVESPDNFWTVRIQPRDQSLRITLRGRPESFRVSKLELKPDMGSYSAFKLSSVSGIPEAVSLIRQAIEK